MSYLHPSQRPRKTEQIGPSSHKNEYHVGVLHGNWAEERNAFGRHANGPVRFEGRTTTKDTYPPRTGADLKAAQAPQMSLLYEAPRQLLFGHGKPQVHMLTTAETSYVNPADREAALAATAAASSDAPTPLRSLGRSSAVPKLPELGGTVSNRRQRSEAVKAMAGANPTTEMYLTTKNVSLDATAATIAATAPAEVYAPHTASHHGEFLRSLGSTMHKTGLRQ